MTTPPPLSPDEPVRLQALRDLNLVETPIEERFERITRLARRSLGVEIAAVSLVESDRQWFKSIQGLEATETSRDVSFCGHAILDDGILHVPDARCDPRFASNPLVTGPPHIVMYAGCPVRAENGSRIGTLCLIDSRPRTLAHEDLQSLRDLAALVENEIRAAVAAAVQASLIEDVTAERRRAMIDPLTRVWNREGILEVAAEALRWTADGPEGAALLVVDFDHFKEINDTHGHAAGDEALRVGVRRMLAAVRETDVVGRMGGDEFLVVLSPCASPEVARAIGQRIRDRTAESPLRVGRTEIGMSVSAGAHVIAAGTAAELEDALETADQALYRSKRAGRGRVEVIETASAADRGAA